MEPPTVVVPDCRRHSSTAKARSGQPVPRTAHAGGSGDASTLARSPNGIHAATQPSRHEQACNAQGPSLGDIKHVFSRPWRQPGVGRYPFPIAAIFTTQGSSFRRSPTRPNHFSMCCSSTCSRQSNCDRRRLYASSLDDPRHRLARSSTTYRRCSGYCPYRNQTSCRRPTCSSPGHSGVAPGSMTFPRWNDNSENTATSTSNR
jgi:hypothetical protein